HPLHDTRGSRGAGRLGRQPRLRPAPIGLGALYSDAAPGERVCICRLEGESRQGTIMRGSRIEARPFFSRRDLLRRCGMGFGAVGLFSILNDAGLLTAAEELTPLAPKKSPLRAKAKRVIHLFMNGGPSHVDTFDPKPALARRAGKPLPSGNLRTERKTGAAFASPFQFKK